MSFAWLIVFAWLHDNSPIRLTCRLHQVDGAYEDWVEVLRLMYYSGMLKSSLRALYLIQPSLVHACIYCIGHAPVGPTLMHEAPRVLTCDPVLLIQRPFAAFPTPSLQIC